MAVDGNEAYPVVSLLAIADPARVAGPASQKGISLVPSDDSVQVTNPASLASKDDDNQAADSDAFVQFCTAVKQMHSKEPTEVTAEEFRRVVKFFRMVFEPSKELEKMIFYVGNQWSVKVGPSANKILEIHPPSKKDPKFRELDGDLYQSVSLLRVLRSEPKNTKKHPAEGVRWAAEILEFVGRVLKSFIASCTSPSRGSSFLNDATWDVLLGKLPPTADDIKKSFEKSSLRKTLGWLAPPVSWALGGKKPRLILEPLAHSFKRSVPQFVDFAQHVSMAAERLESVHRTFAP